MSTFEDHSHGEVRAAELGHGVVAELEEDPLVEALGALGCPTPSPRRVGARTSPANSSRNSRRSVPP